MWSSEKSFEASGPSSVSSLFGISPLPYTRNGINGRGSCGVEMVTMTMTKSVETRGLLCKVIEMNNNNK